MCSSDLAKIFAMVSTERFTCFVELRLTITVTGQATNGICNIPAGLSALVLTESENARSTVPFPIFVFPSPEPAPVYGMVSPVAALYPALHLSKKVLTELAPAAFKVIPVALALEYDAKSIKVARNVTSVENRLFLIKALPLT